jgi:hypothetical protein
MNHAILVNEKTYLGTKRVLRMCLLIYYTIILFRDLVKYISMGPQIYIYILLLLLWSFAEQEKKEAPMPLTLAPQ